MPRTLLLSLPQTPRNPMSCSWCSIPLSGGRDTFGSVGTPVCSDCWNARLECVACHAPVNPATFDTPGAVFITTQELDVFASGEACDDDGDFWCAQCAAREPGVKEFFSRQQTRLKDALAAGIPAVVETELPVVITSLPLHRSMPVDLIPFNGGRQWLLS